MFHFVSYLILNPVQVVLSHPVHLDLRVAAGTEFILMLKFN